MTVIGIIVEMIVVNKSSNNGIIVEMIVVNRDNSRDESSK